MAFLEDLARARQAVTRKRDMAELAQFARAELDLADVRAWDVAWASEKLRQKRYAFSDNEVKRYFPEDAVLGRPLPRDRDALRRAHQAGAGRDLAPGRALLRDRATRKGGRVGQFYLDLYARDGKRGGAWMDDAQQPPAPRRGRADAGGLPHLQLLRAGRRASRRSSPTTR